MRTLAAALLAALPLVAAAQEAQPSAPPPPAAEAAQPQPAPAPPYVLPPQHAPPPQHVTAPQAAPAVPPAAAPAVASAGKQRSPWYAAVAIGGGDGNLRFPGTIAGPAVTRSPHDAFGKGPVTFGLDVQIGATLTSRLLLGGELTVFGAATAQETPSGDDLVRGVGIQTLSAVLTLYPFRRGVFVKGGLGFAGISATDEVKGVYKQTREARGGNVALGAGYAFWLGRRFNLTLNVDWAGQGYGDDPDFESSAFWRAGLGLGWF